MNNLTKNKMTEYYDLTKNKMTEYYDLEKIVRTYGALFWHSKKGTSYWLLVNLVTYFYKPGRKKQTVKWSRILNYLSKIDTCAWDDRISIGLDDRTRECFSEDSSDELFDFLRILKLLSDYENQEKLEDFIFWDCTNRVLTFQKVHIPENGEGGLIESNVFFVVTCVRNVSFSFPDDDDDRSVPCDDIRFYSEIDGKKVEIKEIHK